MSTEGEDPIVVLIKPVPLLNQVYVTSLSPMLDSDGVIFTGFGYEMSDPEMEKERVPLRTNKYFETVPLVQLDPPVVLYTKT